MNRMKLSLVCLVILFLGISTLAYAEKKLGKAQVQQLVVGQTLEGKWTDWETTYKMYLAPDGSFKRVYGNGNKETGEWKINKKGKLCFILQNERCRRVKQRGDGGYNLYNKQGQLKQTIEKISEGNIYNL